MKAREKNEAFALILRGFSQRQVAQMVGVSRSSIERWAVQHSWTERSMAIQKEAGDQARPKLTNENLASLKLRSEELFRVFDEELGRWRAYREGRARKPGLSILKIARIAEVATRLNMIEVELLTAQYEKN